MIDIHAGLDYPIYISKEHMKRWGNLKSVGVVIHSYDCARVGLQAFVDRDVGIRTRDTGMRRG